MKAKITLIIGLLAIITGQSTFAYPLDGFQETGIRRIEAARLAAIGKMRGRQQPPGALLPVEHVDLKLLDHPELELPEPDPNLTAEIINLLGANKQRYGIALLDLSNPNQPRYAEHRGDHRQNVGSVGKIVVALALFQALADLYPSDIEARKNILRNTVVTADDFIRSDHHKVRLWDPTTRLLSFRPLHQEDQGTLWDYLDWMLSASSNAAAAMVMKHAMLLVHFGKSYPVSENEANRFFNQSSPTELSALSVKTFHEPVTRNGLDLENLRQGSFFTRYGKQRVPGTTSYGTARELMHYVLRMEQGRLVDNFSSREIKRLLYMTERRIRYASSPVLFDSAVYFKSGSLYKCKPEPDFVCKKYHGNVRNYMNSVAIVESPAGVDRLHYLVTVISNVLYKNSAVDHQTLATRVHRIIEAFHPTKPLRSGEIPAFLEFSENLIGFDQKREQRLTVAETQAGLSRLGYKIGKVDGKLGPITAAAIKKFQRAQHMQVNGKTSQALLTKIKAALAALPLPDASGQSNHAVDE